jgi:hypothetical protein
LVNVEAGVSLILLRLATLAPRPTVIIYVWLVAPPGAVATIVIVFGPTDKAIPADAAPEATVAPFTVMVVFAIRTVGVTVTLVTVLATAAV